MSDKNPSDPYALSRFLRQKAKDANVADVVENLRRIFVSASEKDRRKVEKLLLDWVSREQADAYIAQWTAADGEN